MNNTTQQYHLFYSDAELKQEAILYLRQMIKEQHFFKQDDKTKLEMLKELSKFF